MRWTCMPSVGFELAIPKIEWFQTYAFDRTATRIGEYIFTTKTKFLRERNPLCIFLRITQHT